MSKFKVGDKVWCNGSIETIKKIEEFLNGSYGYYFHEDCDALDYWEEDELELYKTPHERLIELGFVVDDETNYFISYVFNGLEITIYKKEKVYQTYVYGDHYNPIDLELAEILVDYLEELERGINENIRCF